ncbi:MAG: hypothetical protein MZV64_33565 [Ignavibacteriales bacterium]|nr:hypothetical protein [Ignavibacteriales bacterium]
MATGKDAQLHPKVGQGPLCRAGPRRPPLRRLPGHLPGLARSSCKYYSYVFWAKKPDALFREAMGDYLNRKEGFPRVQHRRPPGRSGDRPALERPARSRRSTTPRSGSAGWPWTSSSWSSSPARAIVRHSFDRRVPARASARSGTCRPFCRGSSSRSSTSPSASWPRPRPPNNGQPR